MSLILYLIITILWFHVALFDYSEFCYIWQLKEYRVDRFKDFISTKQGKDFLKSYLVTGRLFILIVLLLLFYYKILIFSSLFLLAMIFELARILYKKFKKQLRYPKKTGKAALIIIVPLLVELVAWLSVSDVKIMFLFFALRFFILTFVVFIFYLPTKFIKNIYVLLASKKILANPNVKVIGITGSYGKTTVKNYLNQILGEKYNVVATPKNINTEIGIAKFVSQTDFKKIDFFIVEMGAYKLGEIKLICDMVGPTIGVLTAINEQHLSLFGSIENTQKAKFELLNSLPADGLAITNSDNFYCRELLGELKCQVKTFGQQSEYMPSVLINNVKSSDGKIDFSLHIKQEEFNLETTVIGEHNVMNIAPCVIIAKLLEISNQEITQRVKQLKAPEGTLRTFNYGESLIIDDSYNSNPDGFMAAIKTLHHYPSDWKKVVITRGMLELGERSSELHKRVGEEIGKYANELIIISDNFEKDLRAGVNGKIKIINCYTAEELLASFQAFKNIKSVVLLENRIPDNVLRELTK